jgi:hypothetical protein
MNRKIPKLSNIWEEDTNKYLDTKKRYCASQQNLKIKLFVEINNYKSILEK